MRIPDLEERLKKMAENIDALKEFLNEGQAEETEPETQKGKWETLSDENSERHRTGRGRNYLQRSRQGIRSGRSLRRRRV